MLHRHAAYGIQFGSEIPLLEFGPGTGGVEAVIRYSAEPDWTSAPRGQNHELTIRENEARFWFREAGAFLVRDGNLILVDRAPGADEGLIRLYIEGMVTAMLLYQRGMNVLHASVVSINGHAAAFLGHVGAGKSSMAAALHTLGHTVISDDNAAIHISSGDSVGGAIVQPAYPFVKLFPAIAAALGYGEDRLHALHSSQLKIAGSVGSGFAAAPVPLRRLYLLGRDHAPGFQPVAASRLVVELIRNSVPTRWGCSGDREHLERCGQLARSVEAFATRTFHSIEELPALAASVQEHCESTQACFATCPV
jgi:hypothetical protein